MKTKILIASARGTRRRLSRGYTADTFTLELVTQSADGSTQTKSTGEAIAQPAQELFRYEPRDRSEPVRKDGAR